MPSSNEVLAGLARIADAALVVAIAWHVALAAVVIALIAGWRPSRRLAGALLAAPLVSASALAFAYGNPFNGATLSLLATLLGGLSLRLGRGRVAPGPTWSAIAGVGMIAFGWVYPHFLGPARSPLAYLYAAPTGLLPCPSLSIAVGLALLAGGLGSRPWSLALAAGGLLYGLSGALWLGVGIDLTLLAGSLVLLALGTARATGISSLQEESPCTTASASSSSDRASPASQPPSS